MGCGGLGGREGLGGKEAGKGNVEAEFWRGNEDEAGRCGRDAEGGAGDGIGGREGGGCPYDGGAL